MKKTLQSTLYKVSAVVTVFAFVALNFVSAQQATAQTVDVRSLTLQEGPTGDGGSLAGGRANHLFQFNVSTTGNVGSILFNYCTTAVGACTTPTNMDADTNAVFGSEAGSDLTGFSLVGVDANTFYVTRTAASATAGDTAIIRIDDILNTDDNNTTFYVRIATYVSEDTTGSPVDEGTVAASTAEPIVLTGTMPESLVFCTGATVSTTLGVPDCSTATAGTVAFNQLFSPTDTAFASSQMAASTNAGTGYVITVNGVTLASGANEIDAIAAATTSAVGIGQFGLNLKNNATPDIGTEVAPSPDAGDLRGQAVGDYAVADTFKFVTGQTVAASNNGSAGPSDAQIFTVSYIVNVPGNQPAGDYDTTLTYICTPTF
jgi:hypothetical protein